MMTEKNIESTIQNAVNDSLAGLEDLPSQETEILQKAREKKTKGTAYPNRRAVLVLVSVLVLLAGTLLITNPSFLSASYNPIDRTFVKTLSNPTDQESEKTGLSLDRIDLYVDPDLLWNEKTGILAEGTQIDKSQIPFKNAVYREMSDHSVPGEMTYSSNSAGEILLRYPVSLKLGGDSFSMDMPQKSLLISAADGSLEFPFFTNRTYSAYSSLLLRNAGKDCLFTRVADGVQSRLIEKYTDMNILTLAWKPVVVYLNGEYWGQYNMREEMDAGTICRYEGLDTDQSESIAIVKGLGGNGNTGYWQMISHLKNSDPGHQPADREYLEKNIDIDSWLNWLALKTFFGDSDAAFTFIAYQVPGQKWKCAAQGFDYGLFQAAFNAEESYLNPDGFGVQKKDNTVFLKILEIDEYRDLFLEKLGKLYQTLTAEVMQAELDQCAAMIEPEMSRHFERWAPYNEPILYAAAPTSADEALDHWKGRIDRMRNGTMANRPGYVYSQTQEYFALSDQEMARYFGGV